MIKWRFQLCFLLVECLFVSSPASASAPVKWSGDGCVVDGMFFSITEVGKDARVYRIKPLGVDLTPYEGRKVRVTGMLRPGDSLDLKLPQGLEVLGDCGPRPRAAITPQLSWAYDSQAAERLARGDLEGALKRIDRAIELDGSVGAFFLTRSKIHVRRGTLAEAAQDADTALKKGCNHRYPDLEFAGGVFEKAGRRSDALAAFRKAAQLCDYPPDRARLEEKVRQLRREMR